MELNQVSQPEQAQIIVYRLTSHVILILLGHKKK